MNKNIFLNAANIFKLFFVKFCMVLIQCCVNSKSVVDIASAGLERYRGFIC